MSIDVLNVPLFDTSLADAVNDVLGTCQGTNEKANRLVSATGAHGLVYAQQNSDFLGILHSYYMNLPDGVPGVWVGRFKGARKMERCYGPDFFAEVMKRSATTPIKHFFCGGKPGVANELKNAVKQKFNNHNCVGVYSPPFREMTKDEFRSLADEIECAKCDIVWVGLSTPKQERFARALSEYVHVHFIIAVGAAFDFHTDRVRQAPRFIQRSGFEWLFRLLIEPRRLYKRYSTVVPLFMFYAIRDLVSKKNIVQDLEE